MMQVARTLENGVENERQSWQYVRRIQTFDVFWPSFEHTSHSGHKETAEAHIQEARETIRSAERKRDSRESARVRFYVVYDGRQTSPLVKQIVRNVLTFGLGEVFDFFDLNEEIKDAERTVASAQQSARACEQSIQRAEAALHRINDQVARLNMLEDVVYVQETMLQSSVTHGQALRTCTLDLTNASMDVSLFVGALAAKSETLAVHHTAQDFAHGVLNFGRVMMSDGRLNGLLVQQDPGALQETLDMIAQSDSGEEVARLGQCLGTREPQLYAIEDLM